jgi:hypothetical protein
MSLFKSKTIPIKRQTPGQYVRGRWVDGPGPTEFNVDGTIQPTTGDKLQTLLEGKRIQSIMEIITSTPLRAADPKTATKGDIATINEQEYEIVQVMPWQNNILPHYSCIAIREKEGK